MGIRRYFVMRAIVLTMGTYRIDVTNGLDSCITEISCQSKVEDLTPLKSLIRR